MKLLRHKVAGTLRVPFAVHRFCAKGGRHAERACYFGCCVKCGLELAFFLACLFLAFALVPNAAAQNADAAPGPAQRPILYRQHLMSEDLIAEQGTGYLPIQRSRFEEAIKKRSQVAPLSAASRLVEATYRARMTGDDLLIGTAQCKVSHDIDQPVPLALTPCNLAVGGIRWVNSDTPTMGELRSGVTPHGEFRVIVDREGTFEFPWTLRGSQDTHGVTEFVFRLPTSSLNHLLLELPGDRVPRASMAIIQPDAATPELPGNRVWSIEAVGNSDLVVRLEASTPAGAPRTRSPIFVRKSLNYRLTTAGLELVARFTLDASTGTVREFIVDVPESLQIASATIADKPVQVELLCNLTEEHVYRFSFLEPQPGSSLELVVLAVGPIRTHVDWELPTIHLWDTNWQSGSAAVEIVEPLSLVAVTGRGNIARKVEPLPLPDRGELRQFQSFASDANLNLHLAESTQEFVADSGLTLRFAESVLTGQFIADVQAIRGTTFSLRALVQQGWIVDTVQTEPAESFDSIQTIGVGQPSFDIKLKQALDVNRKLRLIIRGHRRNPIPNRLANLAGMKFVRLQGVKRGSGVLALGVESPLRLSLTGDQEARQVEASELTAAESSRINASAESVIFRDESALNTIAVGQTPEQPRYSAQVNIDARVDSQSLAQAFEFHITPAGSHVARVVARIANPTSSAPVWEFVDGGENSLSARQIDSDSTDAHQFWELTLVRPLSTPFRIRATLKNNLENENTIGLASVPEASSQTGIVRVFAADGNPLEITAKNVQTLGISRLADSEIQTLRGAFRYVPSQEALIQVRRSTLPNPLPQAWIWSAQLTSQVSGAGEQQHEVRYYLESKGQSSFSLELPIGATLSNVFVDGVPVDQDNVDGGLRVAVPLPRGRRFPTVSVVFVTRRPTFRFASTVPPVWPKVNLTAMKRSWDIWTPPGFQIAGESNRPRSWDQRLFGFPLVRRDANSFNPFSVRDWRSLTQRNFWGASDEPVDSVVFETRQGPWASFPNVVGNAESAAGWTRWTPELGSGNDSFLVYSRQALQASGWGVLALVVGILGALPWSRLRRLGVVALAVAGVLLLPADLLPLTRAVFYGSVLALLYSWVPRRLPIPIRPNGISSTSSFRSEAVPAAAPLFILFTLLTVASSAFAQRPAAVEGLPDTRPVVHPVLIPVDENQKPTGDYVYVPRPLFDELLRGLGEADRSKYGPLIASAHYEIDLGATGEIPESFQLRQMKATFELSDVALNTTFTIPFQRNRVRVIDVRIDDQPAPFQWNADGQSISVSSENADSRSLSVNLRPIGAEESKSDIDLPIPVIPRSRVTIRADFPLDHVQIPSARGNVEQNTPNIVSAELGPASSLRANWGSVTSPQPMMLNGEVAELMWMQVQPNSAVVRAQFHFVMRDTVAADFVDIEVDPRLRFIPGGNGAIQDMQLQGKRVLRCPLEEATAKEATLELAFTLSGGIGNLRIPHLSARVERHTTKWLAVSVSEGFESELLPVDGVRSISPAEFTRVWGRESESPQLAVALDDMDDTWQLAVRPRPRQVSADQQVELAIGQGRIAMEYESIFTVEQGSVLHQQFRIPPEFDPQEVVVIHDDVNRLLRWARVDARSLNVFFTSPLSGTFRLWLKGQMELAPSGRVQVPILAAQNDAGATIPVSRVKLVHHNDVQVHLDGSPGLIADSQAVTSSAPSQGQHRTALVAQRGATDEQSVQLTVTPNRPLLRGSLVTALDSRDGRWWADVSLRLQISNGFIDTLRLRFPNELELPTEISPKLNFEEVVIPGHGERQFVVHLAGDEHRSFALRMRCAIKDQDGTTVRAPDIRLPDYSNQLQRYILLPQVIGRSAILWDTSGLQAADLPEGQSAIADKYLGADVYQIVGQHMTAQRRATQPIQGTPQVQLADYRLQWGEDHRCQGSAAFDIEPAGLHDVTLVLPEGMQLLNVTVGTIATSTERIGDQHWRVPLGTTSLPQHVEVLFEGQFERGEQGFGIKVFHAPTIADLPCMETLWTVQGPASFGEGTPRISHTRADRTTLAIRRLETGAKLFRSVTTGLGRDTITGVDPWRANREQWLKQLDHDVFQAKSATFQNGLAVAALAAPRYDIADVWELPGTLGTHPVYGIFRGSAERFEVRYADTAWRNFRNRLLVLVLLVGMVAVLVRVRHVQWLHGVLVRYPHFVLGILGFAWWMWANPSIAGLAILVFAAVISLRAPWKTKSI